MLKGKRFPFVKRANSTSTASSMPYLPVKLAYGDKSIKALGLLDTGASVNVLPYEVGVQLGAIWEEQNTSVQLSGNLAQEAARGIILSATVDGFSSISLAFAWTQAREVPLILGHMNFFAEFDVCFYRTDSTFEVRPRN